MAPNVTARVRAQAQPGVAPPKPSADSTPDLREQVARGVAFVRRGLRFWYVPLVTLVVGGLACVGYFALRPRMYGSETVLMHTGGIASGEVGESAAAPRTLAGRVQEMLTSRQLLSQVVEDCNLYPEIRRRYGEMDAVEELKKHVQFKAPGVGTFRIGFEGESAEQAEHVTKRLAEFVIGTDVELRAAQARITETFLAAEKGRTEVQLRNAELQVASFMAKHPRMALDTTPLLSGAAIRASVEASARANPRPGTAPPMVLARPASTPSTSGPRSPVARGDGQREASRATADAAAALAVARATLADKLSQFTSAHPDVRAARYAVAIAEDRLAHAMSTEALQSPDPAPVPTVVAGSAVPPPAQAFRSLRASPTPGQEPGAATSSPQDLVALETEWATLSRNLIEARQHYDHVETELFMADITAGSVSGDNHGAQLAVIDPAFTPQHALPPGRAAITALATVASLALGWIIALCCGALDDRVYALRDLVHVGDVLAEVPRRRNPRRVHVAST